MRTKRTKILFFHFYDEPVPPHGKMNNRSMVIMCRVPCHHLLCVSGLGVNRALAHRYWNLAALQRSPHALIRLGDYAHHGWGVVPVTRRYRKQWLKYLLELDDDIINEEEEKFIDTDGKK